MFLCDLEIGESGTVKELNVDSELRRRLLDLGFIGGTSVKCVFKAPHGDPTAYEIRGSLIALRNSDAASIKIT